MSTPVPGCKVWKLSDAAETWFADFKKRKLAAHPGAKMTEYEFAMAAFGVLPLKHAIKYEFLILCWVHQWAGFQLEKEGIVNHWAVRMAKGFCGWETIDLVGCASSGKTNCAAAYGYTMWKSSPFNTSVYLSTTSAEAGESRTWGAVKDFHKADRYKIGKRIESLHLITLDEEVRDDDGVKERDFRDVIKCINIKSGNEGKNVVASIVGRKNDRVIWICDEMNHMDIGILDARVNLGANPFNQFIGLGNAPTEGTPLYIDAEPHGEKFPDGWRSVDKDRDQAWTTRAGCCLYLNGNTSPNFKAEGKTPFPKLMNETFRKRIELRAGGVDTPIYFEQFFGFPPTVDISDKVLTHKLLETFHAFDAPLWQNASFKIFGGLDLGFRKGGDPCIIHFGKVALDTREKTILASEPDGIMLVPRQSSTLPFEQQIAKEAIAECRRRDCHDISADVTGDGGIMVQAIEREAQAQGYKINVSPISFSGAASDHAVMPGDRRTGKEIFDRKVTELWLLVRLCVQNDVIRGMQPRSKCTSQLCSRRYGTDDKKRFSVEKKEDMKLRLRHSPDHGDAFALLVGLCLKNGLSGADVSPPPKKPPVPEERRTVNRYSEHGTGRYGGR